MSNVHHPQDDLSEEALRQEAKRWRDARGGCPDPDLLLERHSEFIEPPVRVALARHVGACDACAPLAADLDALGLDDADPILEDHVLADVNGRASRSMPWRIPLAAVVLLACGAAAVWWVRSAVPPAATPAPHVDETALARPAPAPIAALWVIEPLGVVVPISSLGVSRSGEPARDASVALQDALTPYQAGRYAVAIPLLEAVVRAEPRSADAALYLGVTYLLTDRAADALPALEHAATLAEARTDVVAWYLAAAEQRAGRTAAARERLHALCLGQGDYRARACAAEQTLR